MRRILTALATLLVLAPPGAAQRYAPAVLQVPASTRALGMADAFPVGGSDSDALFYNLALSQNIAGLTLSGQRWGAGGTLLALSGAAEWWGGRIAAGVLALDYTTPVPVGGGGDDFDEADLFGAGGARSEAVAALGYTRRIKGLRVALVGKAISQRRFNDRETTAAADVSTGIVFGPIGVGLAVQNIGMPAEFAGGDADSPLRLTLGAAPTRTTPLGPLDVLPAVSVARTPDGTIVPAAGVEVGYWPIQGRTFLARFGLRDPAGDSAEPYTLGAGFQGDRIALDWAWASFDDGATHRVSVRWR
jgi:hypothetical protein